MRRHILPLSGSNKHAEKDGVFVTIFVNAKQYSSHPRGAAGATVPLEVWASISQKIVPQWLFWRSRLMCSSEISHWRSTGITVKDTANYWHNFHPHWKVQWPSHLPAPPPLPTLACSSHCRLFLSCVIHQCRSSELYVNVLYVDFRMNSCPHVVISYSSFWAWRNAVN